MSFKYTTGLHNVGPFQVSGMPFATGNVDCDGGATEQRIRFPFVTRWIYVNNNSGQPCRVGFSQDGVVGKAEGTGSAPGGYFFTVPGSGSNYSSRTPVLDLKVSEIWISGSRNVDVVAGLTTIPVARIEAISPSGSNWAGVYDNMGFTGSYGIG